MRGATAAKKATTLGSLHLAFEEPQRLAATGDLAALHTAFWRDQQSKVNVTHELHELQNRCNRHQVRRSWRKPQRRPDP